MERNTMIFLKDPCNAKITEKGLFSPSNVLPKYALGPWADRKIWNLNVAPIKCQ